MKKEFIIIAITVFFIFNTYSDGKYMKLVKSWKKYYQMAGIGFIGISAYIFMRKHPSHSQNLLTHANDMIKYLPIDREASSLLTPFLGLVGGGSGGGMAQQEQRILNSGRIPDRGNNATGTASKNTNVKRSVSETKKKYVAAQQGWNCGACKKQLPAWFEVDHKIRLDNGGSNNVDNLVALCRDCHGKKTAFENL
jgi:5-methylcytosine-specific restriction endonuclease McrA